MASAEGGALLARIALTAACLVILFARPAHPTSVSPRDAIYWWTVLAFGWRSALYCLDLYHPMPSGNTGLFVDYGPMLLAGMMIFVRALRESLHIDAAGGGLLVLSVLSLGYVANGSAGFMAIFSFLLVLPAIVRPSKLHVASLGRGLHHSARILAASLLALTLFAGTTAFGPCRLDKCSHFGVQLGAEGGANALGLAAAIICVLAATTLRTRAVILYLSAAAVIVDLAVSRSAFLPLGLGGAAILAQRCRAGQGRLLVRIVIAASVGSVLYVAFASWTPEAFTGRGALWLQARELIRQHPWLGYGSSFWVRQSATTDVVANYSAHNVALETLVSFGFVGGLVLVVTIIVLFRERSQESGHQLTVALVTWLGASATEVIAAPGRVYIFPAAFILLFLLSRARTFDPLDRASAPHGASTSQQPDKCRLDG